MKEFRELLLAEVTKAHDDLANNGNISEIFLNEEQRIINEEWQDVLNKAFEMVSDFAKKCKMDGLY